MRLKAALYSGFALGWFAFSPLAFGQGAAFTYQGQLKVNGQPANGLYDFTFQLFDAAGGGNSFGGVLSTNGLSLTNGLFTVTLDFGPSTFTGPARWLQISVSPNLAGNFTLLDPRQRLTPAPYAIFAATSATVTNGAIGTAQLANAAVGGAQVQTGAITAPLIASGQVVKSFNALTDNVTLTPGANITLNTIGNSLQISAPNTGGWGLQGTAGTSPTNGQFLGTTDNQPLEIKVNGLRAARVEFAGDSLEDPDSTVDGAPNVILGAPVNFVAPGAVGATIAGGGASIFNGSTRINSILSSYGAIGGGMNNRIASGANRSVIAGGNNIDIGTNSSFSAVGGGDNNNIGADSSLSTIAGGINNDIGTNSFQSAIGGGGNNNVAANSSFSAIAGGNLNDIGNNAPYSSISGGLDNDVAADSRYSAIAGGQRNQIASSSINSAIGGGFDNDIGTNSNYSTIAGGANNWIVDGSGVSAIGGGSANVVANNSAGSTIAGGFGNGIGTNASMSSIGGGIGNIIRPSASAAVVAGGQFNTVSNNAHFAAIGGGVVNRIAEFARYATIGGGSNNIVDGWAGTIGGGEGNTVHSMHGTIAGGENHTIGTDALGGTIGGGIFNTIGASGGAVIGGGNANRATNAFSTVGGGQSNTAGGDWATVPGGDRNTAQGNYSFAAGRRAKAFADGSFVWADSQDADYGSYNPDEVRFRCRGGVYFFGSGSDAVFWRPGFTSWSISSDRNSKEGVKPINPQAVLEKVSRLPLTEWNFKGHSQRHIGPMAQDFHAQFPLNDSETTIDGGDLHGVALAAIQGLNQKVNSESAALREELRRREAENAALKQRLEALEKIIRRMKSD